LYFSFLIHVQVCCFYSPNVYCVYSVAIFVDDVMLLGLGFYNLVYIWAGY
jgi:hypothetical protein